LAEQAKITEILDAVVEEINRGTFALQVQAERVSAINFDLQDSKLHVVVAESGDIEIVRNHRQERLETYGVRIGVLKRVSCAENAQVDPLRYLCQQLSDLFFVTSAAPQQRIGETVGYVTELPQVIYDPDALVENSLFAWVLTLSVQATR